MAVHQLVPSFHPGDAMGQAAVHFRLLLRRLGHHGELYADEVAPGFEKLVQPASRLDPGAEDLVLYHHGIASSASGRWLHCEGRKGVVFHNITPAAMYQGTPLHEALLAGRAQLAAMAPAADVAIGVSHYNSDELAGVGYTNIHTVPLFVEPLRFGADRADRVLQRRLSEGGPALLAVGRVVPHKRLEDLLALHREHRQLRSDARLLLVGGRAVGDPYVRDLEREARAIGNVTFLGKLTHAGLVAAYRSAAVLVSMSEHEGFGVPLMEAMAADLPVLAYASSAVTETLGGQGIAFTEKRFAALAEVVARLLRDRSLRDRIIDGQRERLTELSPEAAERKLEVALSSVMGLNGPRRSPLHRQRRASGKPRVGLVVQRYGDVKGGAEAHAHQVAQRLSSHWDLTVLTTTAADHLSWRNDFPAGEELDGAVKVQRFPVTRGREMRPFNRLSRETFGRATDRVAEERWVAEQGPLCPALLEHLDCEGGRYDGFVFFTYLYAPTAWGLPLVAKRSILVPTAHDEPPLAFDLYGDVFERPRALFCNTLEEEALISRRFPRHAPSSVVGVGVEIVEANAERFRQQHTLERPYLMYVGRIEEGKGLAELLRHHAALWAGSKDAPLLVLAGSGAMPIHGPGVRFLGPISEQEKHDGLAGAIAAVVPSRFESLSLLALEAFAVGTPVLGNGASEVVSGQIQRSGAGAVWQDGRSFVEAVRQLISERALLRPRALAFARSHSWAKVVQQYRQQMNDILENRR